MAKKALRETDLFGPVHDYLISQGYTVQAEVNHCDVAARNGDDLIVIELKRRFGVDLLIQATERQRITDSVYVAVPGPVVFGRNRRWRGIRRLLRSLELGLMVVTFSAGGPRVEVVLHPLPYRRRKQSGLRRAILREMDGRTRNRNLGGSTRRKLMTAYRENAVQIACCLERFGELSPARLRALGTGPRTTLILYDNHYGWFDRVGHGVYALSARGLDDLAEYPDLVAAFRSALAESPEP